VRLQKVLSYLPQWFFFEEHGSTLACSHFRRGITGRGPSATQVLQTVTKKDSKHLNMILKLRFVITLTTDKQPEDLPLLPAINELFNCAVFALTVKRPFVIYSFYLPWSGIWA
jgi:hypothetical protein